MSVLPHSRCNFLTSDNLIIIGACSNDTTLNNILNWETNIMVDLRVENDYQTPHSVEILHLPIKPALQKDFKYLYDSYKLNKKIYIHCSGGHGRSGTIGALLLGMIENLDAYQAIEKLIKLRDTSRNFVPIPEMEYQVHYLVKHLGLNNGHVNPDRSDKFCLKKIYVQLNSIGKKNNEIEKIGDLSDH
jgi:protein-tyrosine phosphatase